MHRKKFLKTALVEKNIGRKNSRRELEEKTSKFWEIFFQAFWSKNYRRDLCLEIFRSDILLR